MTVNFPFSGPPSKGGYKSQLVSNAPVCWNILDFNKRNLCITGKLVKVRDFVTTSYLKPLLNSKSKDIKIWF